jgi:hypothetical protein
MRLAHRIALTLSLVGALVADKPASAFDLEDYATTMRATRDAMLKALNEARLAHVAYMDFLVLGRTYGVDVHEEVWLYPESLTSGSCTTPPGFAFATNFTGPAYGHALANFIREMADVLPPSVWDRVFGNSEIANSWFRSQRDVYLKSNNESMLASNLPTIDPTKNLCVDRSYQYDIEDLLTTLRAGRDAYLKAGNELALSIPPYKAALAAYRAATDVYTKHTACDSAPFLQYPKR